MDRQTDRQSYLSGLNVLSNLNTLRIPKICGLLDDTIDIRKSIHDINTRQPSMTDTQTHRQIDRQTYLSGLKVLSNLNTLRIPKICGLLDDTIDIRKSIHDINTRQPSMTFHPLCK